MCPEHLGPRAQGWGKGVLVCTHEAPAAVPGPSTRGWSAVGLTVRCRIQPLPQ